ncbi:MAG: type II toxin-antitoxin system VapC family toxin [Methylobacter sp.]|uniref:type II toxin-antitoxin system VapC family toxin n=1 Tax=Methylobacter sp. TaxID=2051955 RepID=UPI002731660F|nr:type II toxin-antitoxin system VapC family toxin [Methylobacter sp.]MDP1666173.1 type II toxin-antitoxin system VapC family toxin [Methylobacter sp.]MDP1971089.1 type II toxin-antitoxin system VapC family toxin [Methylobacter sp.]
MGYLIDTNILSELQKGGRCNADVQRWYAATDGDEFFLSVLVIGEIRLGIERLRRRDAVQSVRLEQKLLAVETLMAGRILPVTQAIAERWGRLNVPDPLPVIDGLLAATALEQDLILVTRNVRDVERSGVRLLNPFSAP